MADPVSLTLIGGSVLGAFGAYRSGQAQVASLQAQQNAANYNAQLYQQQAQNTMAQAASDAELQAKNARRALGTQRAAIAQSGIGFMGTGGDLIDQSALDAELDRQNILYSGLVNANSLNSQAEQSYYQASVAGSQVDSANSASYLNAATTLLGGYGQYGQYNNQMAMAGYRGFGRNPSGGIF